MLSCGIERALEADGQVTGGGKACAVGLVVRERLIVDQEDHPAAAIVDQRGREQGLGYNLLLLLVARDERQKR